MGLVKSCDQSDIVLFVALLMIVSWDTTPEWLTSNALDWDGVIQLQFFRVGENWKDSPSVLWLSSTPLSYNSINKWNMFGLFVSHPQWVICLKLGWDGKSLKEFTKLKSCGEKWFGIKSSAMGVRKAHLKDCDLQEAFIYCNSESTCNNSNQWLGAVPIRQREETLHFSCA